MSNYLNPQTTIVDSLRASKVKPIKLDKSLNVPTGTSKLDSQDLKNMSRIEAMQVRDKRKSQ